MAGGYLSSSKNHEFVEKGLYQRKFPFQYCGQRQKLGRKSIDSHDVDACL